MSEQSPVENQAAGEAGEDAPRETLLQRLLRWPGRVREDLEERYEGMYHEVERLRMGPVARFLFFSKILLLHVRYIFGYLAAGFLVSAPLYLGTHKGWFEAESLKSIFRSLVYGGLCALPFIALLPLTRIDWERMRLPEFKIFELALCRWAGYVALAYLIIAVNVDAFRAEGEPVYFWFDKNIAWINFMLMVSNWARIKIQTLIFPDFYSLVDKEGLVLSNKTPHDRPDPEGKPGDKGAVKPAPEPEAKPEAEQAPEATQLPMISAAEEREVSSSAPEDPAASPS